MSSYTDTRTATQNGLIEWDAVDSNVNMPILNYKVNVNLPVYDAPAVYTPLQIQTNNNYVLGDFVNDNVTDYTWLHKSIPVSINVGSSAIKMKNINYAGTNYTKSNFTPNSNNQGSWTISNGNIFIYYKFGTNYMQIGIFVNQSGGSRTINTTPSYTMTRSFSSNSYGINIKDENGNNLVFVIDNQYDDGYGNYCYLYNNLIDYSEFV